MARPERHDVDYFPFIAKRGRTLNILQGKYGLEGIGFFTNLMRLLSLTPDHYYCIKEEYDNLNFFAEIGMQEEEKGIAMIELMVKTEKLDKDLWEKHKVIVCPAFLESIKDAYKERKNKIITLDEIRNKFEYPPENPAIYEFSPEIQGDNPQRIVKDRIGEDTKLNKNKEFVVVSNISSSSEKQPVEKTTTTNFKYIQEKAKSLGFFLRDDQAQAFNCLDPTWLQGKYNFLEFAAEKIRDSRDKTKGDKERMFAKSWNYKNFKEEYPVWVSKKIKADEDRAYKHLKKTPPDNCPFCGFELKGLRRCDKCKGSVCFDEENRVCVYEKYVEFNLAEEYKRQIREKEANNNSINSELPTDDIPF